MFNITFLSSSQVISVAREGGRELGPQIEMLPIIKMMTAKPTVSSVSLLAFLVQQ